MGKTSRERIDSIEFSVDAENRDSSTTRSALSCPCVKFCLQDRARWIPNSGCRGRMSARIPRLPPSRIPQEFRVIESRPSRFSTPRIRRSSRRSFFDRSAFPINANPWYILRTRSLPFIGRPSIHSSSLFDLSLFEFTKRKVVVLFLSRFDCVFNIFIIFNRREESLLKRFIIRVIGRRRKKRNFEYSSWQLSLSTQSNDSRLLRTRQRIPEIPIKLSSSILQLGRLSGSARDTNRDPPPPKYR